MAIFQRVKKAAVSPAPQKAAARGAYNNTVTGVGAVGNYYNYNEGTQRNLAMSVPTISRARDLMASVISCMPLYMYKETWDDTAKMLVQERIAPRSWTRRIDPALSNAATLSWLFDDLLFYGRAFLFVSSRYSDGLPATFSRLPAGSVTTLDQQPPVWFAPSNEVFFAGAQIPSEDLIQFISPVQGIIYQSEQCIATALKLEQARFRNSSSLQPAQVLKQTGGEPLSAEELAALSASFDQARMTNSTCAVNEFLDVLPQAATPDKMLLIDAANFQALEACRLTNIPSYLAGISVGGYSYVSNAGARLDLWSFGVKPYAECIAQTLSMNNVTPQGTYVAFDIDTYLEEDYSMSNNDKSKEENYQPEMAAK